MYPPHRARTFSFVAPFVFVSALFFLTLMGAAGQTAAQGISKPTPTVFIGTVPAIHPMTASGNNAYFVSQSVPTAMVAGDYYNVSVTYYNNGIATWSNSDGYFLGTENPTDNITFGGWVSMPTTVQPGTLATFDFRVRAPLTAGTYNRQRRMVM